MTAPRVLVLVLNYNAGTALDACLRSLQRTTYANAQIVVLDNGSTDGSLEMARILGSEVHEFRENLGYCAAYNRAFQMFSERADFYLLSNADLIVPPPSIERMVRVALADELVGFAGPIQRHADTNGIRSAGIRWRCGRLPAHVTIPGQPFDALEGAFLLVRRTVLEKIGRLDEALALNLEDVEWQLRARKAGLRPVLAADASILHRRPARGRIVSGAYYQSRNALYLTRKYCAESALHGLERRLRVEGRLASLLGRPRGPEILRGIADFHAGAMGIRPPASPGR